MTDVLLLTEPFWWATDPFLSIVGDSWAERPNQAGATWNGPYRVPPNSGNPASHAGYHMALLGLRFTYNVYALGGSFWADVRTTYLPDALLTNPTAIIAITGGNDIGQGHTWATVESNLNACKALLSPSQHLFVSEIAPGDLYSDANAAIVRTFNANFATWCAANGATLIAIHDAFAQTRTSTGQLDDLKTIYANGNHTNTVGVQLLAELWFDALEEYYT